MVNLLVITLTLIISLQQVKFCMIMLLVITHEVVKSMIMKMIKVIVQVTP